MVARRVLLTAAFAAGVGGLAGCARRPAGSPAGSSTASGPQNAAGAGTVEVFPAAARRPAPAVSGELLDGTPFDLGSLRGSVIVVNFWGSWCAPCRAEAPELEATNQATKALGVALVGVDIRDGRDAATAFMADFHLTYPSLFDPPGRIDLAFHDVPPNVVPATVLIDRAYRVAAVFRKRVTQRELEAAVRALATEESP